MTKPCVGILSMQRIYNYGSFLQAYGLKSLLESLGCDVQFVDYEPGECLVKSNSSKRGLARKVEKALEVFHYDASIGDKLAFIRYKRTYASRFYPLLGITEKPNLNPELDLLVIGSDEVFNCVQDNANVGFTPALFGAGANAKRKVTYAASFGNTTLEKLERYGKRDEVAGYLGSLNALSTRDANTGSIVEVLTGNSPTYNLDPVLAYDYFADCEQIPKAVDESNYMIAYGYSGRLSAEECAAVRKYADDRGLKVLNIGGVQGVCDRFVDCSPFDVLAYFKHAEAVVTDTFHGTIFSTIAHTPFATFVRSSGYGNSEKLTDLLNRLGLGNRAAASVESLASTLDASIDWTEIDSVVNAGRAAAIEYLEQQVASLSGV